MVTHRSQNFWLSRDFPYVPTLKQKREHYYHIGRSLILEISVMTFWQPSYRVLRSRAHEVSCFLKLTADRSSRFSIGSPAQASYYSGGEVGSACKGKISVQMKPCRVVHLSSDIFLARSSLRKSLIYSVRNFYNLGYNLRYNFLKCKNRKNSKTTGIFWVSDPGEKSSFIYG